MKEKIEMLEKQVTSNHDELKKAIDDNHFVIKRIEQDVKAFDEKIKTSLANAAAASNSNNNSNQMNQA